MAIYEYLCPECKRTFELMRPMSQNLDPATCPECNVPAEKLISVFASTAEGQLKVPDQKPFRKTD
jgi:putative FmdB family regulatory protein